MTFLFHFFISNENIIQSSSFSMSAEESQDSNSQLQILTYCFYSIHCTVSSMIMTFQSLAGAQIA